MKKILIVLHTLSYTGSPRSAYIMSDILLKNHYLVDIWAYEEGGFAKEFAALGISVKYVPSYKFLDSDVKKEVGKYDLVIANTICTNYVVEAARYRVPVIWYIREAGIIPELVQNNESRLRTLRTAQNIYTVSEYAQEYIVKNYNPNVKVIHNCIEDKYFQGNKKEDNIIRIAALGIINQNKGWDVLIDAYRLLDEKDRRKCEIHLAGKKSNIEKQYVEDLFEKINTENNIKYYGEIADYQKVLQLIADSDIVAVASRDESCSLVALEGLMMGKPVVVSSNVGAKYLVTEENGWIVETGNAQKWKETLVSVINLEKSVLEKMGDSSRRIFLETSTKQHYEKAFLEMIRDNICHSKFLFHLKNGFIEEKKVWKKAKKNTEKQKKIQDEKNYWGVKKNSRVILYGAGVKGKEVYISLKETKAMKLVCWTDKNFQNIIGDRRTNIVSPACIVKKRYDYVLVAVKAENIFQEIRAELIKIGVPEEKIVWCFKK